MNSLLKNILKTVVHSKTRNKINHIKRHIVNSLKKSQALTIDEMRCFLTKGLGLKEGDKIVVSSSFGNLNANFSPTELITLLMDIVGNDGIIMMPFYPPLSSTEWALKREVFDVRTMKSGMGVVTNVFAHMPGVVMSCHPTKAVCVWGKDAEEIIKDHDKSTTPFYWDSPYGRFLKMHSKSIGLGVKNITTMHAIEDILSVPHDYYYQHNKYELEFVDSAGQKHIISTLIHDDDIMNNCVSPGDYVKSLNCKTYKRIDLGYKYAYVIDNDDLFETCEQHFKNGHTRFKK